jgi:hypothetical protein
MVCLIRQLTLPINYALIYALAPKSGQILWQFFLL